MSIGNLTVRAGGITFRGQDGPISGLGWFLTPAVKGLWATGAGTSREKKARQGAHGTVAARGWKDGRVVTLPGYAAAKSMTKRLRMADELGAVLANGFEEPFWADLPDGTTREYIGGVADTDWEDLPVVDGDVAIAKFQIQLYCSNPRAYGDERVFSQDSPGLLEVFNRGTFEARPVVQIRADEPMGGYQLKLFSEAGLPIGNLRMAGITPGQAVSVDMASGRVALNGIPTTGLIVSGDRWHIPPGERCTVMLERSGTIGPGRLTVLFRDTFI